MALLFRQLQGQEVQGYSSFTRSGIFPQHTAEAGRGVYVYLVEGGPIEVNGTRIDERGAIVAKDE